MALGALALGATQWPAKSDQFDPITNALPVVSNFPGTEGGFNPNEVAGALAWMLPLAAGLALYRWREKLPGRDSTLMACALLGAALFFGQSRAAILGVLAAFVVLCFLLLNTRRLRYLALAGVGVLAALQILAVGNAFAPQAEGGIAGNVSEQADLSISPRLRIWESALAMIRDYPLTGVGISFYRYDPIRSMYPVEGVDRNVLVHTHNELLQVGTDLGVPGLIVYVGIHAVAIFMIYRLWKMGKRDENYALAIAAACGILAHTIFGLYDAIPLADRFSFLFWWTFGLLGAAYAALTAATQETNPNPVDKIDGA
jgi:O-antigen ligase